MAAEQFGYRPVIFAGVLMSGVKRGVMLLVFIVSALLDCRREDQKEAEIV